MFLHLLREKDKESHAIPKICKTMQNRRAHFSKLICNSVQVHPYCIESRHLRQVGHGQGWPRLRYSQGSLQYLSLPSESHTCHQQGRLNGPTFHEYWFYYRNSDGFLPVAKKVSFHQRIKARAIPDRASHRRLIMVVEAKAVAAFAFLIFDARIDLRLPGFTCRASREPVQQIVMRGPQL